MDSPILTIRPANSVEMLYADIQSPRIVRRCGCVGYLAGQMDKGWLHGKWENLWPGLDTKEFRLEMKAVVERLRNDASMDSPLKNKAYLSAYCRNNPSAHMKNSRYEGDHVFRADTEKYTYILRVNPYFTVNVYCFCYLREWLDRHIRSSTDGIKLVDLNDDLLFVVNDGGSIELSLSDGNSWQAVCRYVDEAHAEIGGEKNFFSLHQFAEHINHKGIRIAKGDRR